ncbi:MAG: hypothetical protein ACXWWE_07915 [Nitrospira sp.]
MRAVEGELMGLAPEYILIDQQKFSKAKLSLDNHVYKNCEMDDCDIYYSGGQYELIDTHITNSRLILNHPAKSIYSAIQIFKMKSPGSRIVSE